MRGMTNFASKLDLFVNKKKKKNDSSEFTANKIQFLIRNEIQVNDND